MKAVLPELVFAEFTQVGHEFLELLVHARHLGRFARDRSRKIYPDTLSIGYLT